MSKVHIRWCIRRDMPEVLSIEGESFEFSWTEEDFIRALRQRNTIGMVAEVEDRVVGFMVYELHKNYLHLINFAVRSEFRRRGIGAQMVRKLQGKLSPHRRQAINLEVRERNLEAQMFWKAMGFRAVDVLRGFYQDTDEDAYVMRHRYREELRGPAVANRITSHYHGASG